MTCTTVQFELAVMSNQTYFKPKYGLPNPKGPLSLLIPSQAIALAKSEVEKAARDCGLRLLPSIFAVAVQPSKNVHIL